MPGELPYIAGKGALHQLTPSLAAALAPERDHGQLRRSGRHRHRLGAADAHAAVLELRADGPLGRARRRRPADRRSCATDDARWITGQVIASAGGGP